MADYTPNQVDKIVGANLSNKRAATGMTQDAFGVACGITAQQISKYERGDNQVSSYRLVQFAQVLKCPVSDLFDGIAELKFDFKDKATRGDQEMMSTYQALPDPLQDSVRVLTRAIVLGLAGEYSKVVQA